MVICGHVFFYEAVKGLSKVAPPHTHMPHMPHMGGGVGGSGGRARAGRACPPTASGTLKHKPKGEGNA